MPSSTSLLCRAILTDEGLVRFESVDAKGLTLSQTIQNDSTYGTYKPANGKYFTYTVLNNDVELTERQAHKAVRSAFKRWA